VHGRALLRAGESEAAGLSASRSHSLCERIVSSRGIAPFADRSRKTPYTPEPHAVPQPARPSSGDRAGTRGPANPIHRGPAARADSLPAEQTNLRARARLRRGKHPGPGATGASLPLQAPRPGEPEPRSRERAGIGDRISPASSQGRWPRLLRSRRDQNATTGRSTRI
jgi:hypothetical protein